MSRGKVSAARARRPVAKLGLMPEPGTPVLMRAQLRTLGKATVLSQLLQTRKARSQCPVVPALNQLEEFLESHV